MSKFLPAGAGVTRRNFLGLAAIGTATLSLSACASAPPGSGFAEPPPAPDPRAHLGAYVNMYGPVYDEGIEIPAVPIERMDTRYLRQIVPDPTGEPAGTIVVDTAQHFLYLTLGGGEALRYGVGLGREGFEWSGRAVVQWKRKWPKWTPPAEMIARQPDLEKYSAANGGMPPGLDNPLGARALYIFQNGEDTLYRIHGSPEWNSIGKSVSSGCVRLLNQDILDLYDRVPGKAPILVTSGVGMA